MQRAYEKTGKQTIILIDGYDKPLLQTMISSSQLNDFYRKILKGFLGIIKSADKYIHFAFLTGVTRFSKISIFSDLNNLTDISLLPEYAEICGITENEMKENFMANIRLLAKHLFETEDEVLKKLKRKYDGYKFYETGESIYNPYSLLSEMHGKVLKNYWFVTGTPTFLVEYLKDGFHYIPDLDGNILLDESDLEVYQANEKDPLPIMFQAGYLTIKAYNKDSGLYRLGFPNDEVRYAFWKNLIPKFAYINSTEAAVSVWRFFEDISAGRIDDFMKRIQSIISGIPYDNFSKEEIKHREQNYQTAVYLIFSLMGQFVQTKVHCATGRIDCLFKTEKIIYIFEFKLFSAGTPKDAIEQIKKTMQTNLMPLGKK